MDRTPTATEPDTAATAMVATALALSSTTVLPAALSAPTTTPDSTRPVALALDTVATARATVAALLAGPLTVAAVANGELAEKLRMGGGTPLRGSDCVQYSLLTSFKTRLNCKK